MRPLADLVKMAAFMGPTVSAVPYAAGGAIWQFVTAPKNRRDGFSLNLTGPVAALSLRRVRRTKQLETKLPKLLGVGRRRGIRHQLFRLLILWKSDHFPDRFL